MQPPVPCMPQIEDMPRDKAGTVTNLNVTLKAILETAFADYVPAVPAKSHGLVEAELEMPAQPSAELAQGIFALPGKHGAVLCISTNPDDILADSISVPCKIALRVLDAGGPQMPDPRTCEHLSTDQTRIK